MHAQAYAYVARTLRRLPTPRRVVEIGSRDINGSVRALVRRAAYIGIDYRDGPGVDVVVDGAVYQPAEAPDLVLCTEVLEHTPMAAAILTNAHRMLAPGGALIVTAAGDGRGPHSAIDGGLPWPGEHYQNISVPDLCTWLAAFASVDIEVDEQAHDIYALALKGEG